MNLMSQLEFERFKDFCKQNDVYFCLPHKKAYYVESGDSLIEAAAKCEDLEIVLDTRPGRLKNGKRVHNKIHPITLSEYKELYPAEWYFFGRDMFTAISPNLLVEDDEKKDLVRILMHYKNKLSGKVIYPA